MVKEPEYGEIKAIARSWDFEKENGLEVTFTELDIWPCTLDELGIGSDGYGNPKSRFYQISKNSKAWLELYHKKLYCLEKPFKISGNY